MINIARVIKRVDLIVSTTEWITIVKGIEINLVFFSEFQIILEF